MNSLTSKSVATTTPQDTKMARIWFITGCSKGLGLRITEAALDDGDSVVATARKPEALNHLVEKYGADRVLALGLDVSSSNQVLDAVDAAVQRFGRLDVVVNNAGYADIEAFEDGSIESFRAQIDTNFLGVVYVTKAVIPVMRKQGGGRILQVSSVGGRLSTPGLSAYQSAKWAVGGFSSVVQKEVAPFNIKMTVLEPGAIQTDWAKTGDGGLVVSEGYEQTVTAFHKLRTQHLNRGSDPAAMARTIVHMSKVPEPPMRLLLGPMTTSLVQQAAKDSAESDAKWEDATNLLL